MCRVPILYSIYQPFPATVLSLLSGFKLTPYTFGQYVSGVKTLFNVSAFPGHCSFTVVRLQTHTLHLRAICRVPILYSIYQPFPATVHSLLSVFKLAPYTFGQYVGCQYFIQYISLSRPLFIHCCLASNLHLTPSGNMSGANTLFNISVAFPGHCSFTVVRLQTHTLHFRAIWLEPILYSIYQPFPATVHSLLSGFNSHHTPSGNMSGANTLFNISAFPGHCSFTLLSGFKLTPYTFGQYVGCQYFI